MKKRVTMTLVVAAVLVGFGGVAYGGETSLAAYATYWDGAVEGYGGGVKLRKKFLGFLSADARVGMIEFENASTKVVPIEATLMVGIPFVLEPYAGLGASYYSIDSNIPGLESAAGYFGVIGLQFNMFVVGALAEIRYNEGEEGFMNGTSANLGLMVKW